MAHIDMDRVNRVLDNLEPQHADAQLLINDPWSIYYLSGYHAEMYERFAGLLIARDQEPVFFNNALYPMESYDNARVLIHEDTDDVADVLSALIDPT